MKAAKITGLIFAIIMLLGGGALFVVGMGILEWDFKALDGVELIDKVQTFDDVSSISTLDINTQMGIEIIQSNASNQIRIEYFEHDTLENNFSFDSDSGYLKINIKHKYKFSFNMFEGIKMGLATVKVYIPKGAIDNIDIIAKDSNIRFSDMDVDTLNINASDSRIDLRKVYAKTSIITVKDSGINISELVSDKLELSARDSGLNIFDLDAKDSNISLTDSSLGLELVGRIDDYLITIQRKDSTSNIKDNNPSNYSKTLVVDMKDSRLNAKFMVVNIEPSIQ